MRSFRKSAELEARLLAWFRRHRRRLPWRRSPKTARSRVRHAYRVWISEIMLQQTRVAAVVPYFRRFLLRFPDVQALARARTDEVLRHWAGLGYYHRARNLHRAAKEIVRRYGGRFPADYDQALALPGIGPYTAAAILSIAYGQPYAVLDGNVARVLARLARIRGNVDSAFYRKKLEALAAALLPHAAPGEFNQAMMELGATVCLPKRPLCEHCPLESLCAARRARLETTLPGPHRKPARVPAQLAVAIARRNGKVLLVRGRQRFFAGLWQFPSAPVAVRARIEEAGRALLHQYGLRGQIERELGEVKHSVTHHDIRLRIFLAQVNGARPPAQNRTRWVRPEQVSALAVSSATKKIVQLFREVSGKQPARRGKC